MKPGGALGPEEVLNEIGAMAKQIYDTGILDQEQRLTITYDELPTKSWNLKGAGWYGDAHLQRSSSYKFANEAENLPQETYEINKQFTIGNVEMFGDVTFTKDFLVKLQGGVTSFEDFTYKIEDLIRSQKKNLNWACWIGPVMKRMTASGVNVGAVVPVDTTQYIHVGMYMDQYNAAGVLLASNRLVNGISGLNVTFNAVVAVAATDVFYLHEENVGTTTGKGLIGIPFQCDDGTDFPVLFEGLSRTTYPAWRGVRVDAAGNPLTNDLLQKTENSIREQGGNDYMTEDYVNFVHLDSVRRYISIILPQKRYVNASKYDSGMEKPNMLEWNGKPIVIDPDCPKKNWYMYNRAHGGKMELHALGIESQFGGSSMKFKSGYMQGITVTYYSGNLGTNKPNSCAALVNLLAI